MKILIIGSGGREHALAWKLAQSPLCDELYCIPGNGGICSQFPCASIDLTDFNALSQFATDNHIDFTIVGPEQLLVDGIVDHFQEKGLKIFGPTAKAALIEGDKAFAKELMASARIPTPNFSIHHDMDSALQSKFLELFPAVIKVSGLAAGKGVTIVHSPKHAENFLTEIFMQNKFGDSGSTVVVEECFLGPELSIFALTDGEDYILLPPSQDHKPVGERDTGPNTGGMGAYAPAPLATGELSHQVETTIIQPLLKTMRQRGAPYRGLLYCGLILVDEGLQVLEFNCRFGDPETQCVLPLIKPDLLELLIACAESGGIARWKEKHGSELIYPPDQHGVCVVLASNGYPGNYDTGFHIRGLEKDYPDTIIFHAGTKFKEGEYYTSGGRVLGVTSTASTLKAALAKAYGAVHSIRYQNKYFRRDIGWRALQG